MKIDWLAILCLCLVGPATAAIEQADVTGGTVRGIVENGVAAFKGIPFAAPPVGVRVDGILRLHADADATSTPRHLLRVVDNQLPGGSHLHFDMSLDAYNFQKEAYRKQGKYPIRLDVFDEKAPLRITALFASTDEPRGRTFRRSNNWPIEDPVFAAWDDLAMRKMMRSGIRGIQVAITYNEKLVFARAYSMNAA